MITEKEGFNEPKNENDKKKYLERLEEHDWFYHMSDDANTWNTGVLEERYLKEQWKTHPEWEQLYNNKAEEMYHPLKNQ